MVVFDFDQTLSVVHVFKSLAGWGEKAAQGERLMQVPRPYASTELGQVRRIGELDAADSRPGNFATSAFGGHVRVEQVRQFLRSLKEKDVELVICTKGLIGAVNKCLGDLGLRDFFADVYGNIGSDAYGASSYDRQMAETKASDEEARMLGPSSKAGWGAKHTLIAQMMRQRGLKKEQVVLVEDDPSEIRRAGPVCRTLWVRQREGMQAADFVELGRWCEPEPAGGEDAGRSRASAPDAAAQARAGNCEYASGKDDILRLLDQRSDKSGSGGSGRRRPEPTRSRPPRSLSALQDIPPLPMPQASWHTLAEPTTGGSLPWPPRQGKRRSSRPTAERKTSPAGGCHAALSPGAQQLPRPC